MRRRTETVVAAIMLLVLTIFGQACAEVKITDLKIGDAKDWQFVTSQWTDNEAGEIVSRRTGDGEGLQGYAFAFNKTRAYSDLEAEFTVRMPTNHADLGFIFRAQDATHYYMVHFPQCGQGYRAQNFFAALSKADGSGYLRLLKVNLVQRVPSNPLGITNKAKVKVTGDRVQVWVNGHPALDWRDKTYKSGRIGLAAFAGDPRLDHTNTSHGKVIVRGTEVKAKAWNDKIEQVKNWSIPFPNSGVAQGSPNLVKTPKGTLLCAFSSSQKGSGDMSYTGRSMARSTDNGRTWTVGAVPENLAGDMQVLKNGRLVSFSVGGPSSSWSESTDDGLTWSTPVPIEIANPPDIKNFGTGWQIELKDGTLVRFGLGGHPSTSSPPTLVTRWGSTHCQAFATRSTDGGKTWSKPTNLDTDSETPAMGNLDLTEPAGFETTDGRIMCLIRPIYSPWMWETWSSDQGKTFGPCVRGPFAGWAPSTPIRVKSGAVTFPTRFPGVTMHTTWDDGKTWDEGAYIDTAIWAMGSMCEIKPNIILFIYMDSWNSLLRAQYMKMTPGGLMPVKPEDI